MDANKSSLTEFICQFAGVTVLPSREADLFDRLGIDGDDAFEFVEKFGGQFGVELADYRWYFHHGEEGWGLGSLFFRPPYKRVRPIPISIALLEEAIARKRWPVAYPVHSLPKKRWDLLFNQIISASFVALLLVGFVIKFVLH